MKTISLFLSILLSLSINAQERYVVNYQTYGNYNFSGKTIFVESSTNGLTTDDIEFREYSKYIWRIFTYNGASFTLEKSRADIIVYVYCAVSDPQKDVVIPPRAIWNIGAPLPMTRTTYVRYLELKAYTVVDSTNVWKATVTSSGRSGNYSSILPVLCFSIRNSIGKVHTNEIRINSTEVNEFYR